MIKTEINVIMRFYVLLIFLFLTSFMYGQLSVDNFALRVNDQSGMD